MKMHFGVTEMMRERGEKSECHPDTLSVSCSRQSSLCTAQYPFNTFKKESSSCAKNITLTFMIIYLSKNKLTWQLRKKFSGKKVMKSEKALVKSLMRRDYVKIPRSSFHNRYSVLTREKEMIGSKFWRWQSHVMFVSSKEREHDENEKDRKRMSRLY